jgi:hypothetical protein
MQHVNELSIVSPHYIKLLMRTRKTLMRTRKTLLFLREIESLRALIEWVARISLIDLNERISLYIIFPNGGMTR